MLPPFPSPKALVWDGLRCLVTGSYERSAAKHDPKITKEAMATGAFIAPTHCTHIFDSFNDRNLGDEGNDKVYSPPFLLLFDVINLLV